MKKIIIIILIVFALGIFLPVEAASLSGKILLQTEDRGQAWYVSPLNNQRYYLGTSTSAFNVFKKLSLGITNRDFYRAAIYKPARLAGQILLKVQDRGQLYYIEPKTYNFYQIKNAEEADKLIKRYGVGATNNDLAKATINKLNLPADFYTKANTSSTTAASSSNLTADQKLLHFTWKYKNRPFYLNLVLSTSLYNQYKNADKFLSYPENQPPENIRNSFYDIFLQEKTGDSTLATVASRLKAIAASQGFSADETVEFVMAMVQFMPYDTSKEIAKNQLNFPYETLYLNKGVCSDKTFLGLALLRQMGYGAVVFDYPSSNHAAVAVQCPLELSTHGSGYCYIETTNYFPIGLVPEALASGQAETPDDLSDVFSDTSLGAYESYQTTTGLVYNGIASTTDTINELKILRQGIDSLNTELETLKTQINSGSSNLIADYNSQYSLYSQKIDYYNAKLKNLYQQ